jgi:hypothetical protein
MQFWEEGPLLLLCSCDLAQNCRVHLGDRESVGTLAVHRFGGLRPRQSALVNRVFNKIDALLTLTQLSSVADKAVLQFRILSSHLNHLPLRPADH